MQELLKIAIEQAKESIVIFTNHFDTGVINPKIVYANQEFLNLSGFNLEEIIGQSPCSLVHNQNNSSVTKEVIKTLTKKRPWEGPVIIQDKFEQEQVVYFKIIPVINFDDDVLYYACIGQQFENFKKDDFCRLGACSYLNKFIDSIFEQTKYFKEISEKMPTGLWRIDLEGNILYSNKTSREHFGLKMETNLYDYIPSEEHMFVKKMFKNCPKKTKVNNITFRMKNKNQTLWAGCQYWPIFKNDKIVGFSGTIKDVTNEQILIQHLQELKSEKA